MTQSKITFEESQIEFLQSYKQHGFKDKSSLVREALRKFQEDLERKELEEIETFLSQKTISAFEKG